MASVTRRGVKAAAGVVTQNDSLETLHSWVVMTLVALGVAMSLAGPVTAQTQWVSLGPEGSDIRALVVNPTTPTTLYAGTQDGLLKTTTGGASWEEASTGLTYPYVWALALDPTTPTTLYAGTYGGGVFKSTNGGANWAAVNTGLTNLATVTLALDPTTPTTLYTGTWGGGVFKSTTGGASWTAVNTGLTTTLAVRALALDPTTPTTLYAAAYDGVFKSTTGGASWEEASTGLTGKGDVFAFAFDPTTPTTLYAGAYDGVFKSINGGTSWQAVNTGLTTLFVRALALDPTTPTTLYAGTSGGGVFKSTNGGTSWAALKSGLRSPFVWALALGPTTPTTVYAGTPLGVYALRAAKVGVFRPSDGSFYLDANGSGTWDGCGIDQCLQIGLNGDVPLVGVWNGTGTSKIGLFRPSDGTFYLDYNGNGQWDGCGTDRCLSIGMNGDIPLVGDWASNGMGISKVGAFRPSDGTFYLDYNGTGTWEECRTGMTDRCLQIGMSGDIPLVGDWNGNGPSQVGVFRPSDGTFYLDYNGTGTWEGCGTGWTDRCLQIGMSGDIPLVGDWNASGSAKVGVFRPSDGTFYLDYNGSGTWEGCGTDRCLSIGLNGDVPLVGDWNASGSAKVGVFRPSDGTFYLDYNGNGVWDGCNTDKCLGIGMTGDIPLVGKW